MAQDEPASARSGRPSKLTAEQLAWARNAKARGRYTNTEMVAHIRERFGVEVSKFLLDIEMKGAARTNGAKT